MGNWHAHECDLSVLGPSTLLMEAMIEPYYIVLVLHIRYLGPIC